MKSPVLGGKSVDLTGLLASKIVEGESDSSKKDAIESSYEFLKMKLGYSDSLARAATGYVPALD